MPFIDLDTKQVGSYVPPPADFVIVGAGTAGIVLAVKLTREGKSVMLIEAGEFGENEEKQKLNTVEQTAKLLKNAVWGRKRAIGGTTISWGGQSLPFTPLDFEERDWVQNSGWPIGFSDLEPYYKAADAFMGIDTMDYKADIFPKIKLKDPGIDPGIFDFHVAKWTNSKNFYEQHKKILEEKICVIYNAQLTRINKNADNRISGIEVFNFKNDTFHFAVKNLIITAGTIETVRILLNNNLGDHSGLAGKYFMDHPCIEVGTIDTDHLYRLQKLFNTHIWNGHKYSLRLSLSKIFQQQNQLLNCSASIMFRPPKGTFDIYEELKSFMRDHKIKRLITMSWSFKTILKSGFAFLIHRFYFKSKALAKLSIMIEQEPAEDSYIALSSARDQFKTPLALIHWTITKKSWNTAVATANALKKQIEDLNLGKVKLYDHINIQTPGWENHLSDVCHNMGGCRMSSVPEDGVVDRDLRLWEVQNLYICSQAVFPTGSHSNPVLTMLALALRLADHLTTIKEEKKVPADHLLTLYRSTLAASNS